MRLLRSAEAFIWFIKKEELCRSVIMTFLSDLFLPQLLSANVIILVCKLPTDRLEPSNCHLRTFTSLSNIHFSTCSQANYHLTRAPSALKLRTSRLPLPHSWIKRNRSMVLMNCSQRRTDLLQCRIKVLPDALLFVDFDRSCLPLTELD